MRVGVEDIKETATQIKELLYEFFKKTNNSPTFFFLFHFGLHF